MHSNKTICHHTKFEVLDKIITPYGLNFRGSFYEKFGLDDYEWTRQTAAPIIKDICEKQGCTYEEDASFKPIIISFNQEPGSDYMWTHYADDYRGVQLVIDYDVVQRYAQDHLDYFNPCVYTDDVEEITLLLKSGIHGLDILSVNDVQGNYEALSCLVKRPCFTAETEIRYIHPYPYMFSISHEDFIKHGDKGFKIMKPEDGDKELFVCLPKDALKGITIGEKSLHKISEVETLLERCGFDLGKIKINVFKQKK